MIVLLAIGTPAVAVEKTVPQPKDNASIEAQNVGVFTGNFANGMPVYRLPPVSVIAHRKVEEAKKREEREARLKQARAKAAARPPA
jgi:hypothetical protein